MRSKKGGQIGINGEFYKGGTFLPTTRLSKRGSVKASKEATPVKPLYDWQRANLERAIEGTKRAIEKCVVDGNITGKEANEMQLQNYLQRLHTDDLIKNQSTHL